MNETDSSDMVNELCSRELNTTKEAVEIEYRLYTRKNKINYILLDDTAQPVDRNQSVDLSNAHIKIIVHGWISSADGDVISMKDAFLDRDDINVIGVDWSKTANDCYCIVSRKVKAVALNVGKFMDGASEWYGVVGDSVHLIGHSLGAHVVGIAASHTRLDVRRVTGLDPARPLFEIPKLVPASDRIDPSDADFVDIIHSCGGHLGFEGPVGHADFYPNGGTTPQPGCHGDLIKSATCSHSVAWKYFIHSILSPSSYLSIRCDSWENFLDDDCDIGPQCLMGFMANHTARGKFYLETLKNKDLKRLFILL